MKTLIINTYGGSLILGAKALGLEIIGSYEDTGFGLPIQQANFPELNFIPFRKDWPTQNLSDVFVIAHPPCSGFSVQTQGAKNKGVDSSAFACTRSVLDYSMSNGAVGIAIESVVGALAGAWPIHQHYADTYGYNLYRILENGSMFGAQWRDRFWVVYLKKGAAPDLMPWTIKPAWQNVRQVVTGHMDGPSVAYLDAELEKLKHRFVDNAGCTMEDLEVMFNREQDEVESIDGLLWALKFPKEVRWDVCKKYVTSYASGAMVLLSPKKLAPVLLGSSWWYLDGRNLPENAYKRLMGFPADYIFPEGDGPKKNNYRLDMRTYLSKGVMPPIAEWVLHQSLTHLGWHDGRNQTIAQYPPYHLEIMPDMIADFRIHKKSWGQDHPSLRHEDEYGIARATKTSLNVRTRTVEIRVPIPRVEEPPMGPDTYSGIATSMPPQVVAQSPMVEQPPVPSKMVKPLRMRGIKTPKSPWNSPTIEDSLRETLFVRPNSADAFALYESHGYHRMGVTPDDIVLDIGAHIGCVASRAALIGAKQVISVEAEPENFALLEQNTVSFKNVIAIHGAVYGGDTETVKLNRVKRRNEAGFSTGTHSVMFNTNGDSIEVPRVDFRKLIDEYKPTVIKFDAEGAELTIDWTNLPSQVRSLGIEFHHRYGKYRDHVKEIVASLGEQGFKPVHNFNTDSNFGAIIGFFSR